MIPQVTPITLTPALVDSGLGLCFNYGAPPTSSAPEHFEFCIQGKAEQNWSLNQNGQIINPYGQCVAGYDSTSSTITVDNCAQNANHIWTLESAGTLRNSATQQCLEGSVPGVCGSYFFVGAQPPQPPSNNLIANNDSYGAVASPFASQEAFKISATKGVGANDTPSGDLPEDLVFQLVDPIRHIAGGRATAELNFEDNGSFKVTLRTSVRGGSQRAWLTSAALTSLLIK